MLQVKFIFSDKTGTLTCNIMELKQMTINGEIFEADRHKDNLLNNPLKLSDISEAQRIFMIALAICHTIVPEREKDNPENILYQGASPGKTMLQKVHP